MRDEAEIRGPLVDIRVRWRAGQVALGLAGVLALVSLTRPLSSGASPRLRLAVTLALGLGVSGSALLASLRGRGRAEQWAFYAFLTLSLDALGQVIAPLGWPMWPLMTLLVGAVAVAEHLPVALGAAGLAGALAFADAVATSFATHWKPAAAASLGYLLLVIALNRALLGEKRRLGATLAELARIQHGIDQLDELDAASPPARPNTASLTLRQVSEEGRRLRQSERAQELDESLAQIVRVARAAVSAHAVVYFDVDRQRDRAYVRAAEGPAALIRDSHAALGSDPFAFVLDRRQSFYATDFTRLLWELPYYRAEMKIGSLLALPVLTGDVVSGVLVADQLETQAFTGKEPELLQEFATMAGDAISRMRASLGREEMGAEFKAVYGVSRSLATLNDAPAVQRLLVRSARDLVPLDGAAVVMADEAQTRYVVEHGHGWPKEFEGREVGITERTWAAWVLRSAEEPYLLDDVAGQTESMPILVLDEGGGRGESLLAVPLKSGNRTLGALVLTGPRGVFDAAAHRVLGILANQAAAALSTIRTLDRAKTQASKDGLTGLYNRRAFTDFLRQTLAREERLDGRFALLLLDLDHFKKLNDTYGHPAGDAALRTTAEVLERHLRKADVASRYGGEEFVVILSGADEEGALHLAERVRKAIQKNRLVFEGAKIAVTASFGLAVWPADGKEGEALIAAADRALYAAKEGGRNRVVAASALGAPGGPGSAPTVP